MRVLSALLLGHVGVGYTFEDPKIEFSKIAPPPYMQKWNEKQTDALFQIDTEYKKKQKQKPFVVMISGNPKTGKTTLLEGIFFHFKYNFLEQNHYLVNPYFYKLESKPGEIKNPEEIEKILKNPFIFLDDSFISFDYLDTLSLFRIIFMSYNEDLKEKFISLSEEKINNIKAHCCFVDFGIENPSLSLLPLSPEQSYYPSSEEQKKKLDDLKFLKALQTFKMLDSLNKELAAKDKKDETFNRFIRSKTSNDKKSSPNSMSYFIENDSTSKELKEKKEEIEKTPLTYQNIYNHVTQSIKKQDQAVKKISNILMSHKNFLEGKYFQNARVLLHGPSGCGKTAIVSKIAEKIDMPFFMINASSLTGAGYKGQNLSDQLGNIIDECENKGIDYNKIVIFFDEIDKLFAQSLSGGTTPGNVLNELLIFMEKGITERRGVGMKERIYEMSTKNSAIFFAGAFHQVNLSQAQKVYPEFFGRIHTLVKINQLKDKDFCEILLNSNESPYVVMKEKLEKEGRSLFMDPDAVSYLGKYAVKRGTGSRAIQYALSELLIPYFGENSEEKEIHLTLQDCKDLFDEFMNDDSDLPPRGMYL